MKFCAYCGKELTEGAEVCLGCGKIIQQPLQPKPKQGKSIASLVLGIISALWAFSMLASLRTGVEVLTSKYSYMDLDRSVYFVAYYIGYTLFALTPGLIALILGSIGYKKKKNGFALAGIILSSIALLACIYVLTQFIAVGL